jgi:hypothetical protein
MPFRQPPVALGLIAILGALAGCGTRPETVPPSHVSATTYRGLSCAELADERKALEAQLPRLYGQQRDHNNATTTAGLTALPTLGLSTLILPSLYPTRDRQDEIARIKGEIEAVDAARAKQACDAPQAVTAPEPAPAAAKPRKRKRRY